MTARRARRLACGLLAAAILVFAAAGCGRKAKPEPKWGARPGVSAVQYG